MNINGQQADVAGEWTLRYPSGSAVFFFLEHRVVKSAFGSNLV